jgi:hypothetical protein
VSFWTYICYWQQIYSNKVMLLLSWSHPTQISMSSSRTGWLLRNIHFSNDNRSLPFYEDLFSFLYYRQELYRSIWVTWRVSHKKKRIGYTLRTPGPLALFCSVFDRSMLFIVLVFCVVFVCLRSMLYVALDCSFWITHSVSSTFYL